MFVDLMPLMFLMPIALLPATGLVWWIWLAMAGDDDELSAFVDAGGITKAPTPS